jgi:hypothetical protein
VAFTALLDIAKMFAGLPENVGESHPEV